MLQYNSENTGSHAEYGVDSDNVFDYAFVSLKPCIDLLAHCGLNMFAIDGTFSRNRLGGVILFLVGREVTTKLLIPAFMICRGRESTHYYEKFGKLCKLHGVGQILGDDTTVYGGRKVACHGDRDKGMDAFFTCFTNLTRLNCLWHLVQNVRHENDFALLQF